MNRERPIASIHVQQKTEARKYALHMERLQKTRPSIDNRKPRQHVSANGNGKRLHQQQERRFEIEYENAVLLDKMRRISTLGTTASNYGLVIHEDPEARSLNANTRRRELERITRENLGIVRRIQVSVRPSSLLRASTIPHADC